MKDKSIELHFRAIIFLIFPLLTYGTGKHLPTLVKFGSYILPGGQVILVLVNVPSDCFVQWK